MSGRCEECGASTVWDQDIGSAICLQCGTLADPTQSVLTTHLEQYDTSGHDRSQWSNIPGASTLRGRNGRVLAGQEKEARDRRNTISMHEFIRTLTTRLGNPGATTRAQGIFDQAMRVGQYRWGRKAKLTAGAALAISLRESHKSDSIRDIAYLLDETPVAVSRAFTKVVQLLQLGLSVADPAMHIPTLQTHLVSLLQGAGTALPAQLSKVLSPLVPRLPSISRTAISLSTLIARTDMFNHLPTPPTACALFMLALEAELTRSLPNAAAFAQALGARLGAGKAVVMQRYKQTYDLVEEWIRDVPWLEAHQRKKAKGREGEGRSKVAKRVVVARGLKDVVQFQEEIWRKRMENGGGRPVVQLDTDADADEKDDSGDEWGGSEASGDKSKSNRLSSAPSTASCESAPPRKKAKTSHPRSIVDASQFLLDPLSASMPAVAPSSSSPTTTTTTTSGSGPPDLLTHLLTADASSLPHMFVHAPTRLQLLANERGGTDEQHIADDELFAADELDGLMRSPEEAEAVRIAMGWSAEPEDRDAAGSVPDNEEAGTTRNGKKRKRSRKEDGEPAQEKARGSKKINMDALARLLDPDADLDAEDFGEQLGGMDDYYALMEGGGEKFEEDEEAGSRSTSVVHEHDLGRTPNMQYGTSLGEEEVVEEWRPLSPGGGGEFAEDWYDF
ncbi:hypothetical protein L226DRAFT_553616 [Lentinus tigrinus ALCF2SS1-7]|uniref:B-related factor 1 n=1 Tax=Lentinus tigrinus ALCF2SS1-6 TaxID=1328759 RepID=A0A5C2S618_9APHY|nr:hypothetical protein L227DRAFT_549408 [Lentinus tigrinus ALCF2SS1-6]RPD73461.1 hypothetical protein L226DRAFT_553616 [Lentinus tigrinus ALCF2SS1-7]